MKASTGVDVQIHIVLTLALTGGERSASRSFRFTPRERGPVTSVGHPVASRYTHCSIPALMRTEQKFENLSNPSAQSIKRFIHSLITKYDLQKTYTYSTKFWELPLQTNPSHRSMKRFIHTSITKYDIEIPVIPAIYIAICLKSETTNPIAHPLTSTSLLLPLLPTSFCDWYYEVFRNSQCH
jgi:hypothetical protein